MAQTYDECLEALKALVAWDSSHKDEKNEATTRLKLIDRLFFECLAWSKDDVVLEESQGKQYADYTFSLPRRILIVEAKKEGDYFEVPAGKTQLEYSLSSLCRDYPNLKAAIEQAARYCQGRGVPFGAVCNGHQLVAFVATRSDGLAPLEGKGLVFPSLQFMLDHFLEFWNSLAKPGIKDKHLYYRLVGDLRPSLPPKLSASIMGYPGLKSRNIFQTDLQILSELVMEDLARSRELEDRFLKECYCQSGALSQYSLTSKAILAARYTALFDSDSPGPTTVPAHTKDGISPELLAESLSRRPILLIGDVGVGKTTFIRHFVKVEAASLFENCLTLYIDLGSKAALTTDIRKFIRDDLTRQLRDDHSYDIEEANIVRGIYPGELGRFRKGIYGDLMQSNPQAFKEREIQFLEEKLKDKESHLRSAIDHLAKGRKKQVVVFLDNADQRDEQTQQQTFLIAQEIAENWPVVVFVALRPETYHRSRKMGALSGYHAKAFTISPPRIDVVLNKRLTFALRLTSGDIPIKTDTGNQLYAQMTKLGMIIKAFLDSLKTNNELSEFIDNISGGNVRLALDFVKDFFGSGHVNTQKIVDICKEQGSYNVPLHEFLRAVMYGDAEHYDPSRSPLANVFDISQLDPKEHFLLPLAIATVASLKSAGQDEGFAETAQVYETLQGFGYTPEQIDSAVVRGCEAGLLEPVARRIPQGGQPMPIALRATTVGLYHVSRLCRLFAYIDAVTVDTPLLDDKRRSEMRNVVHLQDRIARVKRFQEYLNSCWGKMGSCSSSFDWNRVSAELSADLQRVSNSAGV